MNYLAHLFLAEKTDYCLIGSLAGDFVKGPVVGRFPEKMERGIVFHRSLDRYTDEHQLNEKARKLTRSEFRRMSGILLDLMSDYFLSLHWDKYADFERVEFIRSVYGILQNNRDLLPDRMKEFSPRMIEENWLGEYASLQGVIQIFMRVQSRMKRATLLKRNMVEAEIVRLAGQWEELFLKFFPQAMDFAEQHHKLGV